MSSCGETVERLIATEQLEALEQTRRDVRAGDGQPDRLKRLSRLLPELVGECPQRLFDGRGIPRLDRLETRTGRRADVGIGAVGRDRLEQEAAEVRVLREALDLLLHQ